MPHRRRLLWQDIDESVAGLPALRVALILISLSDIERGPGPLEATGRIAEQRRERYAQALQYVQQDDVQELLARVGVSLLPSSE